MASLKLLLYKSNKNNSGQYPFSLRIIKNRVPKYINIAWIHEKDWDYKERLVKKSHIHYLQINNKATSKLALARNLITQYESEHRDYDFDRLIQRVKGDRIGIGFFIIAKEYEDDLIKRKKVGTLRGAKYHIKRFKKFVNDENITFEEINSRLIKKFIGYLEIEGYGQTTIASNLSFIRNMYNKAIDEDLVKPDFYPFGKKSKIKVKYAAAPKIGLNIEEIRRFEALKLEKGTKIWHTQKAFLFSFYLAGMRIGDVLSMKWSEIQNGRLYYSMNKNDKYDSLKLPDKALEILKEYEVYKEDPKDVVFPYLKGLNLKDIELVEKKVNGTKSCFNYYLKIIAKMTKLEKNLSCHIARHTFGNIAGDKITMQSLQKLYRHSDLSTTINYQSNFDHSKTDGALNNVLDF